MHLKRCDVLVVGGGPAGSAAATLFAEAGYDVRLFERATFPRRKPCGEFLSPEGTRILARLAVEDAVRAAGARRLRGLLVSAHGEPPLRADFSDVGREFGYALERSQFDTLLLERARAAGARVHEGWAVEGLEERSGDAGRGAEADDRCVRVRDGDGKVERWRARLTIGAGGKRCPIARDLGVQRRPDGDGPVDLLCHWETAEPAGAYCELHVGGPGYTAMAPVGPHVLNVNTVVGRSWLREKVRDGNGQGAATEELRGAGLDVLTSGGAPARRRSFAERIRAKRTEIYHELVRSSPALARATRGARPLYTPVGSDIAPLWTERASTRGVLLAGDSALFIDPFTGQGLYLALRSAELAFEVGADALAAGDTGAERLARYDRLRRTEFAPKITLSRILQAILHRPWLARRVTATLRRDRRGANRLIGVIGDYRPASELLQTGFLMRLTTAGIG